MSAPAVCVSVEQWKPAPNPALGHCIRALVVSPELEIRKALLRKLEALQVEMTVCATRAEAEQILGDKAFDIIFCDEYLPDGTYFELVQATCSSSAGTRVVVTTRTGDWELYFAALEKGAFDVIRCPCQAQDVEMTIARLWTDGSPVQNCAQPVG
jgi:DNA-binding NtrC family response regulator